MGILTDQVLLCQSGEHNGQMSEMLPCIPGRGLWELQGQALPWLPPCYLSGYNPLGGSSLWAGGGSQSWKQTQVSGGTAKQPFLPLIIIWPQQLG